MVESLTITLVGMGLVFVAILLFWLVLARPATGGASEAGAPSEPASADDETAGRELRRRAASVAVAVVLARQAEAQPQPFPMPPTVLVTAWQAVNRSRLHGQRGPVR